MTTTAPTPATPKSAWNPWPAALIGFFALFIGCIIAYTAWALRQRVDLVGADYYDQEIRYQQQIDRLGRTREFHGQLAATYDAGSAAIHVSIPAGHVPRASGVIHFYRPADARLDREVKLVPDPQGRQSVPAGDLAPGLWKVRVQWSVAGQDYCFDRTLVIGGGLF